MDNITVFYIVCAAVMIFCILGMLTSWLESRKTRKVETLRDEMAAIRTKTEMELELLRMEKEKARLEMELQDLRKSNRRE